MSVKHVQLKEKIKTYKLDPRDSKGDQLIQKAPHLV